MAIWWGLEESGSPSSRAAQIETDCGKRPPFANTSGDWWQSGTYPTGSYVRATAGSTLATNLTSIWNNGQIPYLSWYSNISDASFALKEIYQVGLHDTYLTNIANDFKALGFPILLRFDGEMNGTWRTSYYERNGFGPAGHTNAAGDFILMWQHVWNIMAPIAPNLTWFWCPNQRGTSPTVTLASVYPGSRYVDWIGCDSYNWAGSQPGGGKTVAWATFSQTLRGGVAGLGDTWTDLLNIDPNMPIALGEHGCDTREGTDTNPNAGTTAVWNGQKKADWFTDEFNVQLPGNGTTDFTRLKYITYFNDTDAGSTPPISGGFVTTNGDWPLEDPTAASGKAGGGLPQAAFGANTGVNSTYYARGGQFLLPAMGGKVYPYEGTPQVSRFDNAILHTAQSKLQGFWKLNELGGTVATDYSGNVRTGTYTGGFTLGQPKLALGVPTFDTCPAFNGSTGYVTVPNNAAFWVPNTGKLTVVLLFQCTSLGPGNQNPITCGGDGNGYGWDVRITSAGALVTNVRNLANTVYSACTTANGVISAGVSYFICWSIDTSLAGSPTGFPMAHCFYGPVGGTLVTNKTSTDTPTLSPLPAVGTGTLNIGRNGDNTNFFNGKVQRVAIYSDVLTQVSAVELFAMCNTRQNKPRNWAV